MTKLNSKSRRISVVLLRMSNHWLTVFFCMVILLFPARGIPQTAGSGSIQGTVADPTGAVIPNASVSVTNNSTRATHTTKTGAGGLYSFPNLPVGTYTVSVSAPGFESYSQAGNVLEVGSSIGVNVKMTIGEPNVSVDVTANGLALQTEDSTFKQTIDQRTIEEMPLNGRQVTSLILLSGAAAPAAANDIATSKNFYSSVVISLAGGMGNATDYRLDGGDNNDYMTNINLPFPFPDATSQFSVESTVLGAQQGLHSGGLVNAVTRSGSNQWHGSAFDFIRNNYINANKFFSNTKDSLHQHQFGGTLGGKIIKDKVFFFGGYQRLQSTAASAFNKAFVPTTANLTGDFSGTDTLQLVNPQTGAKLPNNHISPTYFNAQALNLAKHLPTADDQTTGLVSYSIPVDQTENQYIGRVDAAVTQKHSVYARYFLDDYTRPAFYSPTNILITNAGGAYQRAQSLTFNETWTINSRTVNSFHATGTRRRINRGAAPTGINATDIGVNIYSPPGPNLGVNVGNGSKWTTYSGGSPAKFNVNVFSFSDDVSMVRGKHQIGFGGEYVRIQFNARNGFQAYGQFNFSGIYSQIGPNGLLPSPNGQDANLDFLTGALSAFSQSGYQQNASRGPIPSLYVQDTYHPTKRLVLNAGLRWEPHFTPVDAFNRGSIFSRSDFIANNHSSIYPNAPAGVFFYGDKGVTRGFTQNSVWQFSPRVAVTFDPEGNDRTVFRAGGALVYDEPNLFTGQRIQQNPPYATQVANNPVNSPLSFTNPWSSGTTPRNIFPIANPPSPATAVFPFSAQYIFLQPHFKPSYTAQWTANMERDLGHGWQFLIDYIGNKSSFLPYGYPLNTAVYIPGQCGANPCSTPGNSSTRFALNLANPTQGPRFSPGPGGSILGSSGQNASYNALVTSIQHRMSSSFSFLANYTWSHCINVEDGQGDLNGTTVEDPNNISRDRGNCGFDRRHIFNIVVVAESHLPLSGWKALALNHWLIAPLVHITDGTPFTVFAGQDNSLTFVFQDRPDLVNPGGVFTRKKITSNVATNVYINGLKSGVFAQTAPGTYGNLPRNTLRGPGNFQLDSTLSRSFPLHERLALQLRLEAFNVLNHPNFNNPSNTSLTGGQTYGLITSTSNDPRIFQAAVKLTF